MKKFILLFAFIFIASQAFGEKVFAYSPQYKSPLIKNINMMEPVVAFNSDKGIFEYPKITEAEKTIFGQSYENQELSWRLNRLEHSIFNKTYPNKSYEQRVNNIIVNYNANASGQIPLSNLTKLENSIFNKNYLYDTPQVRIERLEMRMFGAAQSGNLKDRYYRLSQATNNSRQTSSYNGYSAYSGCNSSPYNNGSGYYSRPIVSGSGWKSILGSMGNSLLGYPTGMTPQMDPSYMDTFEADRYYNNGGDINNVTSNRGYSNSYIRRGSGSGVRILD